METPATPETTPADKSGWVPTRSTIVGAVIGGAAGQVLVSLWNSFVPAHAMDLQTAGAVNTLCVALAGYFFPDGGRK